MSATNNRNRKLQQRELNLISNAKMADDAITSVELGANEVKSLCFMYDFSTQGGAVTAITLTDKAGAAQTIPDNAVMVGTWFEGNTTITSGGSAQIALGVTGAATALKAATVISDGGFAATAVTALSINKTTSAVSVLLTPSVAALTAGKFFVWIQYYEGA